MAEFAMVKESDAPKPTKISGRLASRMIEYDGYLNQTKAGSVGKLTPGEGESARGISLRLARAAKRIHKPTSVWISGNDVYFKSIS